MPADVRRFRIDRFKNFNFGSETSSTPSQPLVLTWLVMPDFESSVFLNLFRISRELPSDTSSLGINLWPTASNDQMVAEMQPNNSLASLTIARSASSTLFTPDIARIDWFSRVSWWFLLSVASFN